MGKLILISTPIGNLEDISKRAIDTLSEVDLVACEDTRRTGQLLSHFNIKKPLISYYEENEQRQIPQIISEIKNGKSVGLVTDSGTPSVSDPGFRLVRECVAQNIEIDAIPGPSAAIMALSISGLPTNRFLFEGFLPPKQGKRLTALKNLKKMRETGKFTIILYESPYRLVKNLEDLKEVFGDVDIVVCRELTKVFQEIRREKVSQSIDHFSKTTPKGEFTLVF
jgi:16S rRNA (cytidine1402-2'-O)-methyltransferase